ncbi:MAG TPA: PIN domain-containing protein [Candidatus Polarisedimenticolia bacterium]|nr:PIN domain-containing protein [Candidatus Polarisedimenticolia bacterium]
MAYTALLDANVLHPMVLCDLLIRLAQKGMFRALWSREILEETVRSIARRKPDIPIERLYRRVDMMNQAIQDAEVTGYEGLVPAVERLKKDAHVLAAAIKGKADVIVSVDVRGFPPEVLTPFHIAVQHPDDFLLDQLGLRFEVVRDTIAEQAACLKRPPKTLADILVSLEVHTPNFVREFRSWS